eukprot:1073062-Prymnesium_polylepis.2
MEVHLPGASAERVRAYAERGILHSDPSSDRWRAHDLNSRAVTLLTKLEEHGFLPFHVDFLRSAPKCCHAEMSFFNTRAPLRMMPP